MAFGLCRESPGAPRAACQGLWGKQTVFNVIACLGFHPMGAYLSMPHRAGCAPVRLLHAHTRHRTSRRLRIPRCRACAGTRCAT